METLLGIIRPLFWGLLMLSALVFVHEGGHFLASRAVGVRVTEFFLGLPCRFNLHHVSRRIGTKFGVTPLLLGGYAMVCGMEPEGDSAIARRVLAEVHRRGTATVAELSETLSISEEDALAACVQLLDWGSIEGRYDEAAGEKPGVYHPSTYAAAPRDNAGATLLDGAQFKRAEATSSGEAWEPPMGEDAFFDRERSHTYAGKGFFARAFILVAGVAVNLVSGFLLLMAIYMFVGITATVDVNTIGTVEAASPAAAAGIEAGDTVLSVAGTATDSFSDIANAIGALDLSEPFDMVLSRDDQELTVTVDAEGADAIGITAPQETVHLNPAQAASVTWSYLALTADSIMQLVNPQRTLEVLDSSTSVVGISVMAAAAAESGASTFLSVAALISFSLGFMNLLPIPPLDGGKLVIEIVQAVIRRPLSVKVQTALSYIGIALFGALFIYLLRADIIRFIL